MAIPAIQDGEAAEARHRRTGLDNYGSSLPVLRVLAEMGESETVA